MSHTTPAPQAFRRQRPHPARQPAKPQRIARRFRGWRAMTWLAGYAWLLHVSPWAAFAHGADGTPTITARRALRTHVARTTSSTTAGTAATGTVAADDPTAESIEQTFIELAQTVGPSVVTIASDQSAQLQNIFNGLPFLGTTPPTLPDFLREHFGSTDGSAPAGQFSLGSGVVVDDSGSDALIVTNAHLVNGLTTVTVVTADGRSLQATVAEKDDTADLAVLRVQDSSLTAVPLAQSDDARVGQWALAFGDPLQMITTTPGPTPSPTPTPTPTPTDPTNPTPTPTPTNPPPTVAADDDVPSMTVGIVSDDSRDLTLRTVSSQTGAARTGLIQTSAESTLGQGGGPLVNINGELIGINFGVLTNSPAFAGSLAIPIAQARALIDRARGGNGTSPTPNPGNGDISPPPVPGNGSGGNGGDSSDVQSRLGLQVRNLTDDDMAACGLPDTNGVIITSVTTGGLAQQAGIRAKDVIVRVNGTTVTDVTSFTQHAQTSLGGSQTVVVEVHRHGTSSPTTKTVTIVQSTTAGTMSTTGTSGTSTIAAAASTAAPTTTTTTATVPIIGRNVPSNPNVPDLWPSTATTGISTPAAATGLPSTMTPSSTTVSSTTGRSSS